MEMNKEDYIMAMDVHERNLYCYALHTVTSQTGVAQRTVVPDGLISAVSEAERGNYIPLREQETTLREISKDY